MITGAMGFVGRQMTEVLVQINKRLLADPIRLTLIDNLVTGQWCESWDTNDDWLTAIESDVTQPLDIEDIFPLDYVIHAAGIASPYHYRARPLETLDVATTGTRNLLELAKAARAKFVFFSSSEIYGDPDPRHIPIPESYRGNVATMGPRACYDEGKRLGETLTYIYHEYFGLHTNIIRPFNVYGPEMGERDYRVMPNFASAVIGNRPLRVYGDGRQTRTFCYVTDALIGFFLVTLNGVPGAPYNIGNPEPELTMHELAEIFLESRPNVTMSLSEYPDSYPADEPRRRVPDITKARLQLGYSPEVPVDVGIDRFLTWAEQHYTGNP